MADTLKSRVGRVVAGSLHALLDRIEDLAPEAAMEQAIREADAVLDEVRHELGIASANRHLAQQQHAKLNQQHETLSAQIEQALAAARDDLAEAAVARQLDIEAQIPVLETTLADMARQESELQGYVAALLAKRREMEGALADYRRNRAQAVTSGAAATAGGLQQRIDQATGAFDRIHGRQTGLAGTSGTTVEQATKLRELEDLARGNKIAERLARLKAGRA